MERNAIKLLICTVIAFLTACGGSSGDVTQQEPNEDIKIYFYGSDQSHTFYNSFHAYVYIEGDRNIIRLEDTPSWITIVGDENKVYTDAGDITVIRTGNGNEVYQTGPFSN